MIIRCKSCMTSATLDDDEPIPLTCPSCAHASEVLDYMDGTRPMVIRAWFRNLTMATP